jgi:hypothetical protein
MLDTFLIYKRYRATGANNGYTSPFLTFGIVLEVNGTITTYVTIGANGSGTLYNAVTTSPVVAPGEWHHVGSSFDASEGIVRTYVNGVLVFTSGVLATGNIDWNTTDPGGWNFGSNPFNAQSPNHRFNALRVCNVKRPGSWFADVFASEGKIWTP